MRSQVPQPAGVDQAQQLSEVLLVIQGSTPEVSLYAVGVVGMYKQGGGQPGLTVCRCKPSMAAQAESVQAMAWAGGRGLGFRQGDW